MKDILVGIDAGTSVIKSVAFSLTGEQLAESATPNHYEFTEGGGVEQNMSQTWQDTLGTLRGLAERIPGLAQRLAAIAVTGQGDGTWLIDKAGNPVIDAWLWLDARAGALVSEFISDDYKARLRFEQTGTGFAACQQAAHMMWMQRHMPEPLAASATAFHCKDWLYYQLTGERVTDPSEGCFTFGDFRNRRYSDTVLELLGLEEVRSLLPPMLDGVEQQFPLSVTAADATGLLEGTPVVLGYVDVLCTALGAGLYDRDGSPGCTVIGSTGVHMRLARRADAVVINPECTGFTMPMPIPGVYAQMQSNLASTINIDWLLDIAVDLLEEFGVKQSRQDLVPMIDNWLARAKPAEILYQPYISEAGERGPIIEHAARAGFVGLNTQHRFADLVKSIIEGLAMAARDCYTAMGEVPAEIRLTGGAARNPALRAIFSAVLGADVRTSAREEAGAAGAAMMAAVAIGHYSSMDACVEEWVKPFLGDLESPDPGAQKHYENAFPGYVATRKALRPIWQQMANNRQSD